MKEEKFKRLDVHSLDHKIFELRSLQNRRPINPDKFVRIRLTAVRLMIGLLQVDGRSIILLFD